jgi:hypothetical protein
LPNREILLPNREPVRDALPDQGTTRELGKRATMDVATAKIVHYTHFELPGHLPHGEDRLVVIATKGGARSRGALT